MNILYLHSHDTGRYVQPYGYPVETPALQQLAEEGVLFRNAHCAAPTCSPSRAALLTGQASHSAGMVGLAHRGSGLKDPAQHLAHFLKERGYETVLAGIQHVGNVPACGYTVTSSVDHRIGEQADYAIDYLRGKPSKPFFLDVGFIETHRTEWVVHGFSQPHFSPHDGDGNADYVMPPCVFPDNEETRRDWLDFRHSVERLDGYYGRILKALDEAGLADDTLVIATTDHGIAFPGMKCSMTHHGTGVLQILRAPKHFKGGRVLDALVSHIDFFPTVCDLLGEAHPDWLQGTSLLPLLKGDTDSVRDETFAEVTFHAAFEPKRSVRTQKWNYIRNFAAPHSNVMPNCDDGLTKQHWMAHGMADRPVPREELYDLTFDPQERQNVADDPNLADVVADLRKRLDRWMHETGDPFLIRDPETVLPLPQKVNTWDQLQPGNNSVEWDPAEWDRIQPL